MKHLRVAEPETDSKTKHEACEGDTHIDAGMRKSSMSEG